MKLIRRIIAFLLGFILFNLIGFLVISFAFKDVMQNQIIGGIVKEELIKLRTGFLYSVKLIHQLGIY